MLKGTKQGFILVIVIILVASAFLFGCQLKSADSPNNDTNIDIQRKGGFRIFLLDGTNSNAWRQQMEQDMQEIADKLKTEGIISSYQVFEGNNDAEVQAKQLEIAINSGVDAILINPVSAGAINPIIDRAVEKGIIVMSIDQHISHPKVINISTNQYERARIQAEWLAAQLNGTGSILQFDGIEDSQSNDVRRQAFEDVLSKYPGIKVLKQVNADGDENKAKQLMTELLSTYADFDAVLSQDDMEVGIINALQEANYKLPEAITSDEWIAYLRLWHDINAKDPNKPLNAMIVGDPPGIGADGLMVAVNLLQGRKFRAGILKAYLLDKDNLNAILLKPSLVITNDNMEEWYQKTKDEPDTYYLDEILPKSDIISLFEQ